MNITNTNKINTNITNMNYKIYRRFIACLLACVLCINICLVAVAGNSNIINGNAINDNADDTKDEYIYKNASGWTSNMLKSVNPVSTEEIKKQVETTYQTGLSWAGRTSFKGWCGSATWYQLCVEGLYNGVCFNGKDWYDGLKEGEVTAFGYTQVKYPGDNCIRNLVAAYGGAPVYNIVVSYTGGSTQYGHVMFIKAIVNGYVYFTDSFKYGNTLEGKVRVWSVDTFVKAYKDMGYSPTGAIHFVGDDSTKPVISNKSIIDVTQYGYTVSCYVTDDKGIKAVKCATWTRVNGQDDVIWRDMTVKNGVATVTIPYSAYDRIGENGESKAVYGTYINHIYAYDTSGNQTVKGVEYYRKGDYKTGTYRVDVNEYTSLNMRDVPGVSNGVDANGNKIASNVVEAYLRDDIIEVTKIEDNWGQVEKNDIAGWVCLDYCVLIEEKEELLEEVEKIDLNLIEFKVEYDNVSYDGNKKTPKILTENLVEGTDYTVEYMNNVNVGLATVKITGIGNYVGEVEKRFYIKAMTVGKLKVTLSQDRFVYSGKYNRPTVTVTRSDGTVVAKSNYSLKFADSKKVGTATVTITFKKNYTGTKTKKFKIVGRSTQILKTTEVSGGFIIKWKKYITQNDGYRIQYSTNKKFTDNVKTVYVKNNRSDRKTFTGLKKRTNYWVRIQTYKVVNGKKVCSDWCKAVRIKTKN